MLYEFPGVEVWPQPFDAWWCRHEAEFVWERRSVDTRDKYVFSSLVVTR